MENLFDASMLEVYEILYDKWANWIHAKPLFVEGRDRHEKLCPTDRSVDLCKIVAARAGMLTRRLCISAIQAPPKHKSVSKLLPSAMVLVASSTKIGVIGVLVLSISESKIVLEPVKELL